MRLALAVLQTGRAHTPSALWACLQLWLQRLRSRHPGQRRHHFGRFPLQQGTNPRRCSAKLRLGRASPVLRARGGGPPLPPLSRCLGALCVQARTVWAAACWRFLRPASSIGVSHIFHGLSTVIDDDLLFMHAFCLCRCVRLALALTTEARVLPSPPLTVIRSTRAALDAVSAAAGAATWLRADPAAIITHGGDGVAPPSSSAATDVAFSAHDAQVFSSQGVSLVACAVSRRAVLHCFAAASEAATLLPLHHLSLLPLRSPLLLAGEGGA